MLTIYAVVVFGVPNASFYTRAEAESYAESLAMPGYASVVETRLFTGA